MLKRLSFTNALSRAGAAALAVALLLATSAQAAARQGEITIEGRLARTVESGGWLVIADAGRYLILNPARFQTSPWFKEGAAVEATGEIRTNAVTIYNEGVPFQVRTMRAQGRGTPQTGGTQAGGSQTGGTQTGSSPSGGGSMPALRGGLTRVTVTGDAVVQAQPDTAVMVIAVVTQNASATEAQAENASKTEAVVRAVRAAAGQGSEVKTSGYSLQPQYAYREGSPPTITSYVVRNAVNVTTGALDRVGAILDAAARAGANTVDALSFTLRRDEQARNRALTDATREAARKARVVAEALGGRVVRIVEVQEAGAVRVVPFQEFGVATRSTATAQVRTPIEAGTLEIRSEVHMVVEIEGRE